MNKYKIQKIVYADCMSDVEKIVSGGETSWIELIEEKKEPAIGFNIQRDDGKRK